MCLLCTLHNHMEAIILQSSIVGQPQLAASGTLHAILHKTVAASTCLAVSFSFAPYGAMECSPGWSPGLPGRNPGNQNPINIEPRRGDGMAS